MQFSLSSLAGALAVTALAASPAIAGAATTPEPEVAAGLVALGLIGVGYRLLRRRFQR